MVSNLEAEGSPKDHIVFPLLLGNDVDPERLFVLGQSGGTGLRIAYDQAPQHEAFRHLRARADTPFHGGVTSPGVRTSGGMYRALVWTPFSAEESLTLEPGLAETRPGGERGVGADASIVQSATEAEPVTACLEQVELDGDPRLAQGHHE